MRTDTGGATLRLAERRVHATLPLSLRYATGYFTISYGLL